MTASDVYQAVCQHVTHNHMPLEGSVMHYTTTDSLPAGRLHDLAEKVATFDVDADCTSEMSWGKQHSAKALRGLLYLACNGLDEAHNIITPYSWPSKTPFGGDPIHCEDGAMAATACYIHGMVHRREGQNIGEFGTGWNNAGYWFGNVGAHFLYPSVREAALRAAESLQSGGGGGGGGGSVDEFVGSLKSGRSWNAHSFLDLCESAVQTKDVKASEYCRDVMAEEWLLLASHLWQQQQQ
eukprot:GFYU01020182.1.p1 GENE.GFYU01020182.1~~GFYU01020182.1.p1  ORF type:complete len:239 (+),score=43.04 GFYU01020182.1:159-875(+)